jgi:hypothetical protein
MESFVEGTGLAVHPKRQHISKSLSQSNLARTLPLTHASHLNNVELPKRFSALFMNRESETARIECVCV